MAVPYTVAAGSANARVTTLPENVGAAVWSILPSIKTCMASFNPVAVMVPETSAEAALQVKTCTFKGPIENERGSLVDATAKKAMGLPFFLAV